MEEGKNLELAKKILTEYLQKKEHRKTPERYAILKEIYSKNGHFTVEELFVTMQKNHYRVSKATLYNTMELLLDCNLVIKHQFGKNLAYFEKTVTATKHDHLICTFCGKIIEFSDSETQQIIKNITEKMNFETSFHTLCIYGICDECR